MQKRLCLILLVSYFVLFNVVRAEEGGDGVCRNETGRTTFHCSSNMPNVKSDPNETAKIEIQCCVTGENLNDKMDLEVIKKYNWEYRKQNEDLTWNDYNITYLGTSFITKVQAPKYVKLNKPFDIKLTFRLPPESPSYTEKFIDSRIDLMLEEAVGQSDVRESIVISSTQA